MEIKTKYCKYCKQDKSIERFNKGRAKCKDCLNADKRRVNKGILLDKRENLSKDCTKCGAKRDEVKFHPKKNLCVKCNEEYMREYRKKNKEKLRDNTVKWKQDNKDRVNQKAKERYHTEEGKKLHILRSCKTWRVWVGKLISTLKSHAKRPGPHDPKFGPKCDFDIDIDYVLELGEKQNWRCALTGLPMIRERKSHYAASIDRIDSEKGHVKGNIQIICQGINWLKRHYSQEDTINFLYDLVEHGSILNVCGDPPRVLRNVTTLIRD